MKKHPYRALLIWAALIISIINIVPTVGWMLTPSDPGFVDMSTSEMMKAEPGPAEGTREWKLKQWNLEDSERAKERPNFFTRMYYDTIRWAQFDREHVINLGLDLQGGIHMVLGFNADDLPADKRQEFIDAGYGEDELAQLVQESILQKIVRRANEFDAKEPVIQALGTNQIQIQLPGEKDIDRARRLITMTAKLDFNIVVGDDEAGPIWSALEQRFPDEMSNFVTMLPGDPTRRVSLENFQRVRDMINTAVEEKIIPEDKMIAFSQTPKAYQPQEYSLYLLEREPIASGEGLTQAYAAPDQQNPGGWQILFQFNATAGEEFGTVTEQNIGRPMAIVVDNVVLSAPTIRDRISTSGQITGDFDGEDARDLAIALNSGSMAVPVHEEFTNVIGPSLGAESVRAGVISGVVGLIVVAAFMILYYRFAGLIAVIALVFNGLLIVAGMAYFNMTLTLPGIAGLILTIGMAVDSNVLIYERIREELKLGHTLLSSIDSGFKRAAITILDANITTLIAAAVLFQFGTGPIEGFAVTLCIGILGTLFTALVVSRALFDFFLAKHWIKDLTMMSLIKGDLNYKFMEARRVAIGATAVIMVIGLGWFGVRSYQGNMYGVDFTQGTNLHLSLNNDSSVPVNDLRVALAQAGFESPMVQETAQRAGDTNTFLVRVSDIDEGVIYNPEPAAATDAAPAAATPAGAAPATATPAETTPTEIAPTEIAPTAVAPSEPAPVESIEATPAPAPAEDTAPAAETAPAASSEEETPLAATAPAPLSATGLTTVAERIQQALAPLTGSGSAEDVRIESEQTVGPAVGAQLRIDALKSIFWSLVFIVIYLAFRFELKFAAGAVVAVIHDVLFTVGVMALLGREIDMNVIAALLTIIGYSLNDTIVIFDRVREDIQLYRGKGYSFDRILNIAINSTLSRTILTSLTVLFVVVVTLIFGGAALRDFSLALTIGVVAGTYSTVFIASPVVYWWHQWSGKELTGPEAPRGDQGGGGGGRYKRKKAPGEAKGATA